MQREDRKKELKQPGFLFHAVISWSPAMDAEQSQSDPRGKANVRRAPNRKEIRDVVNLIQDSRKPSGIDVLLIYWGKCFN